MYTIEEFDRCKSKVMNYIMFKKRTEYEVKMKFLNIFDEELLNDIIAYLREAGYLSDEKYIDRAVNEFIALKNLSIKEIKNKLAIKGVSRSLIDDYVSDNREKLDEYEYNSAKKLLLKKSLLNSIDDIKIQLMKKGYTTENINRAIEDIKK